MPAMSDAMTHRFLRDYQITLPVQRADFLDYYATAFDEYFDFKKKLYEFLECRLSFSSDEDFYVYRNNVVNEIISSIENHSDYKKFNESKTNFKEGLLTKNISGKSIFSGQNAGKTFVSIDLRCGNFFALKNLSSDLMRGCKTWQEFVRTFTNYSYFGNTKHLRQSVLGKLNPKRILNYEKMILDKEILNYILTHSNLQINDIVNSSFDEIIFKVDDGFDINSIKLPDKHKDDVHVEMFKLERIDDHDMYIKRKNDGFKLKCVDINLFPQVYKYVTNRKLHEKDMYFVAQSGQLAKYIEPLFK